MKKTLCTILASLLFLSCEFIIDEDSKVDKELLGSWLRYESEDIPNPNEITNPLFTYDPSIDRYYYAFIYHFEKNKLIRYAVFISNPSEYTIDYNYEIKGDKILVSKGVNTLFKFKYKIEDSHLYLDELGSNGDEEFIDETGRYVKYDGEIPPPSFLTGVIDDEFENNDSYTEATPILADGTDYSLTLKQNDDDWFSFSAIAGKNYSIRSKAYNGIIVSLFDTDGSTLILTDRDDTIVNVSDAAIYWQCSNSGTYYIKSQLIVNSYPDPSESFYLFRLDTY